jgi:hypothetical protein
MNDYEKEPKLWVTVLKLSIGAIIFIIAVGLGLYYSAEFKTYAPPTDPPVDSWGVTKDSPLKKHRL